MPLFRLQTHLVSIWHNIDAHDRVAKLMMHTGSHVIMNILNLLNYILLQDE